MKKFNIILAVDEKGGIGRRNSLAWNIPSDMRYFKNVTTITQDLGKMNAVVMGRKTWESIPSKFKPLSDRVNCILTREIKKSDLGSELDDFVLYFNSLDDCFDELEKKENVESIYIIGGGDVYNQVLSHPMLDKIYITKVKGDFECDVILDPIPSSFVVEKYSDWEKENGVEYSFWVYKRVD